MFDRQLDALSSSSVVFIIIIVIVMLRDAFTKSDSPMDGSLDHGSAETTPNKFMVKNDNQLKMVMINGIETSIMIPFI